jgi:hypothetical protein
MSLQLFHPNKYLLIYYHLLNTREENLNPKITLLSDESFFVTEFKGEILNWQSKRFGSNGPIIEPYEASFLKYLYISEENSLAPLWFLMSISLTFKQPWKPIGAPNSRYYDLSLNIELIDTNVKEDLSNYEIVELKKLSQSRLNEKVSAHIIDTHNKVVNSGLPNYQVVRFQYKLE